MSETVLEPPNELVRWLRLLALPLWARSAVAIVLLVVLAGGTAVLALAVRAGDAAQASSALGMLTIALPVLLVVLALVFGQDSDERLRRLTVQVLKDEVPRAIRENQPGAAVDAVHRGCSADYEVRTPQASGEAVLRFSVELNVHKINLCFWFDDATLPARVTVDTAEIAALRHVVIGALAEGYRLNEVPAHYALQAQGSGLLFYRSFAQDFLMLPGQRLYFAQDLSFFVRGVMEAQHLRRQSGGRLS